MLLLQGLQSHKTAQVVSIFTTDFISVRLQTHCKALSQKILSHNRINRLILLARYQIGPSSHIQFSRRVKIEVFSIFSIEKKTKNFVLWKLHMGILHLT